MRRYVNLMSDQARFRAQAWIHLRRWAVGVALLTSALVPLAGVRLHEAARVRREHEALEASYDPIKRLNGLNTKLRAEAKALVRDERLALDLARQRPTSLLLARVSAAAEASGGELFVQHLSVAQNPPRGADQPPLKEQLVVEAAATLTYDIGSFVKALHQGPIREVKVTSDEVVAENGVEHKSYVIECSF